MPRTGASGGQQARADAQSRPWRGCALIVRWAGSPGLLRVAVSGEAAVSRARMRDTTWAGTFWPVTESRSLEDHNEHFGQDVW